MKLKTLKEASYHGRQRVTYVVVFDVPDGDKIKLGPFKNIAQANKFEKDAMKHLKKKVRAAGHVYEKLWDAPVIYVEDIENPEVLDQLIDEYLEYV